MHAVRALALLILGALALAACGGQAEPEAAPLPAPATVTEPPQAEPPTVETEPPTAETRAESTPSEEPPPVEALPGLPEFTAGYRDWLRLNEEPIPPNPSGDAHLGTKNVYASKQADRAGGELVYPQGTIIVKEAKRPETSFIGLIAVMRKEKSADPAHNDWVFVEWTRSSPTEPFRETASDAVCWSCHMNAAETDYVWVHTLGSAP
jgi:hypothetical protein